MQEITKAQNEKNRKPNNNFIMTSKPKIINHIGEEIKEDQENLKVLTGNLLSKINLRSEVDDIHQIEFKVFSQFGEDGIIQYIINKLKINCVYIFYNTLNNSTLIFSK